MFKDKNTLLFELKQEFAFWFPTVNLESANGFEISILQTFAYLYDTIVRSIEFIVQKIFPQNASGFILDLWIQMTYGARIQARTASGSIWISGEEGASLPINTSLTSASGENYRTLTTGTVESTDYTSGSATKISNNRLRFTTSVGVSFPSLSEVTVTGTGVPALDGNSFIATVDSNITTSVTIQTGFDIQDSMVPSGSFTITSLGGVVNVVSTATGYDQNASQGEEMSISLPAGSLVDANAVVYNGSIIGGSTSETDEEARLHVIRWLQSPVTYLNEAHLIEIVSLVPSVTRVFIQRATPAAGQARIFCIKDRSVQKELTAGEIQTILNKIEEELDITHVISDFDVLSPDIQLVNLTVSGITSYTESLKNSIRSNINAVFLDVDYLSGAIDIDLLRAAVANSVDGETLESPKSFELTVNSGSSLTIATDKIGAVGTITFA
jgi:uncharacterized phage protein gp47/JayE